VSSDTGTVVVDQHWYLTGDKSRVVPEGDPGARWLWAAPGDAVPRGEALRLGALRVAPVTEPVQKHLAPLANKVQPAPSNKGR